MTITLPLWAAITVGIALPTLGAATALLIARPTTAGAALDEAPTTVIATVRPWPTPLSPRLHELPQFAAVVAPGFLERGVWTPAADTTTWPVWDAVNAQPDVWLRWTRLDYLLAAAVPTVAAGAWVLHAADRLGAVVWLALHQPAAEQPVGRHRADGHRPPVVAVPAPVEEPAVVVDDLDAKAAALIEDERALQARSLDEGFAALLGSVVRIGAHR